MRALAVAVGASLLVNAVAVVWLRPSVATAAIAIADSDDRDSDVSRDEPDLSSEVVVELIEEPAAGLAGGAVAATNHVAPTKAAIPTVAPTIAHAPDSAVGSSDSSIRAVQALDSEVRTSDSDHTSDSDVASNTEHASDRAVRASDSTVRASDSAVRASDSTINASDSTVGASEVSGGSTGAEPTQVFVRTLDAILAPADASTGGAVPETGPHSKMMGMRGVDLALTTQAMDAILSRPDETARASKESPEPPDEAAQLRHDIVELDKRMMGPDLDKYRTADEIDGMREELEAKKRDLEQMTIHPTGGGHYGAVHETYTASIEQDGTTHLHDRPNWQWHGLGATFDVTDWAMRSSGDDPYARAKTRFLDRTRPERIAIGKRYRAEQLAHAPQLMQANIERVWTTIQDPEARKDALFELWDDCAEVGEPAVVEAGAAARLLVLGVIHARVTYSAADLERLNRRRHSTARFEP